MKSVVDARTRARRGGSARSRADAAQVARAQGPFTTISGRPIERLYTADDVAGIDYDRDVGNPGEFPYVRGIHPTGYRGKLWTMRQFAGFGTPEETNQRYKDLIAAGGTGLSVAFDLPTLMGRDPDHPLSLGEVGQVRRQHHVAGRHGAAVRRHPARRPTITTSMTINSPAPMIFAMYLVVAEQQGADWKKISGTIQNDILKEFIAQKEYIFPPRQSMRLITDIFAFCAKEVPKWNTISVSGYHIREAGSTALQELAFTLRDGLEYVQYGVDAGLDVDEFVPRMSFFFNSHSDFFEEIAKYRAARKLWAEAMQNRFGAKNPRSWQLRFHTQTAGVSLTAQQPYNNVVRTALQALAAVLGGTNSLHTNSLDEALALPTKETATHRAAHAADHRARERRHQRRRSAGRLVLRRAADARHGRGHAASTGTPSTAWAAWSRRSSAAIRRRKSPKRRTSSSRPSSAARRSSSASTTSCRPTRSRSRSSTSTTPTADLQLQRLAELKRTRDNDRVRRTLDALQGRRAGDAATPCRRCSTACAPTRRSARCATRSAKSGASTKKCRSFRDQ